MKVAFVGADFASPRLFGEVIKACGFKITEVVYGVVHERDSVYAACQARDWAKTKDIPVHRLFADKWQDHNWRERNNDLAAYVDAAVIFYDSKSSVTLDFMKAAGCARIKLFIRRW